MKETVLFNQYHEPEAISVSLEDLKEFLLSIDSQFNIKIQYEDYDDYGCDHFLSINGKCADIVFQKDYGGLFCPSDSLICKIYPHVIFGDDLSTHHEYKLKTPVKHQYIGSQYEKHVRSFIDRFKGYLEADPLLFTRYEYFHYEDAMGEELCGNERSSYTVVQLNDDEFHTGNDNQPAPVIHNMQLWKSKEANVLSTHRFDESYTDIELVNEWEIFEVLIKEKKLRWVIDSLIINDKFFINNEGHLDATKDPDNPIDINMGCFKFVSSISGWINAAYNAEYEWDIVQDLINDYAVTEERDEIDQEFIEYWFKDDSRVLVNEDNLTLTIVSTEEF